MRNGASIVGLEKKSPEEVGRLVQQGLRHGDQQAVTDGVGEAARRAGIPTIPTRNETPNREGNQ